MVFGVLNETGLVFLAFLIPLLLLYLIKPKPLRKTIPSLMFILNDTGKNKVNRLFRNWLTDILLIFHFLIVAFLALSLAQPYIEVSHSFTTSETIVIFDVSANMQPHIEEARSLAEQELGRTNTLIQVSNRAELLLQGASASQTRRALQTITHKDTTSNLGEALSVISVGPQTHVVIVSNFLVSEGNLNLQPYIQSLESRGALVTQHVLGEPRPNIGIIDLSVREDTSRVWVKNFDNRPQETTLRIGDSSQELLLARGETQEIQFQTPVGTTQISITDDQGLQVDNTVWVSTPTQNNLRILVLTNNQDGFEQSNMNLALDTIQENFPINFEFEYAIWPRVPTLDHDIYIFYDSNPNNIIPGHIRDLRGQVEQGAALIIKSQEGLFGIDFQGLLPLEFIDRGGAAEVQAAERNLLTNDIFFGQVQSYDRVRAQEGTTVLATANDNPILTISRIGRGTSIYYGYREGQESFSIENSYPVFLRRLIDFSTNRPGVNSLNVRTGTLISLPEEQRIQTPQGTITARTFRADNAGLYRLEDRVIAANLLSDLESDTNRAPEHLEGAIHELEFEEERLPYELANILILLALIVLLLELLYIKFRGDI